MSMSSQVVDAQAVRDRLLRCVQHLGNAALRSIEHTGTVGNEALLDRIHSGLAQAALGIPNAALFPDDALSRALSFICVAKANIGGLDETAPELEPHEKLAGCIPRSNRIEPDVLTQHSHLMIRFLQEVDYELIAKYFNFFDAYYTAACQAAAEKLRGHGDSIEQ